MASGLANPGRIADDASADRVAVALPAKLVIFSDGKFGPVAGFELGNLEPVFRPVGRADGGQRGDHGLQRGPPREQTRAVAGIRPLGKFRPRDATVAAELYLDGRMINADKVEIAAARDPRPGLRPGRGRRGGAAAEDQGRRRSIRLR